MGGYYQIGITATYKLFSDSIFYLKYYMKIHIFSFIENESILRYLHTVQSVQQIKNVYVNRTSSLSYVTEECMRYVTVECICNLL